MENLIFKSLLAALFIGIFVVPVLGIYPTRCYRCRRRGWAYKMHVHVLSGSSPETCEAAHIHPECEKKLRTRVNAWRCLPRRRS